MTLQTIADAHEEVALVSTLRSPNLLLIGPDAAIREFLDPLIESLDTPVVYCDGATPEFPTAPTGVTSKDSFVPLGAAANLVLLSEDEIEAAALRLLA